MGHDRDRGEETSGPTAAATVAASLPAVSRAPGAGPANLRPALGGTVARAVGRTAGNRALLREIAKDRSGAPGPISARRVLARDAAPPTVLLPTDFDTNPQSQVMMWADLQSTAAPLASTQDKLNTAKDGDTLTPDSDSQLTIFAGHTAPTVTIDAGMRSYLQSQIRYRLMELLYKVVTDQAAAQAAVAGPAALSTQLANQADVRAAIAPLWSALRKGDPALMFDYPPYAADGPAIIAAALTAGELMGEGVAEDWLGKAGDAHAAARRGAGWNGAIPSNAAAKDLVNKDGSQKTAEQYWNDVEWCGAFAAMCLNGGGMQSAWMGHLHDTAPGAAGNVDGLFLYMDQLEIEVGGQWFDLYNYHVQRRSVRKLQVLPNHGGADWDADTKKFQPKGPDARLGLIASLDDLDAQAGDIVLIDNNAGTYADHITLCRSYDKNSHTLWTIGGNEGAATPVKGSDAKALDNNPEPVRGAFGEKASRVYAVGRFSVVDWETHKYRARKSSP